MCSTLGFRQHRITTFVVTWIRRLRTVFREPSVPTSNASTAFKKPDQLHIRDQFVLVFCGPPCGGKSYLHEAFKRAHPQVSFNEMDQIRLDEFPGPINDEAVRGAAYRLLHRFACREVNNGKAVALNATYMPQRHRAELAALVLRSDVAIYVVQCVCSPDVAVKRFRERALGLHAGSDLTALRVRQLAERFERFDGALLINTDTDPTSEDCLSLVHQYLNQRVPTDPVRWAQHEYASASTKPQVPRQKKLSEASVRAAKRLRLLYHIGVCSFFAGAIVGFSSIFLKLLWVLGTSLGPWYRALREQHGALQAFIGSLGGSLLALGRSSLQEAPVVEWVHFSVLCLALAGLASIVVAFYHDSKTRREEAKTWADAGRNPRYALTTGDARPSDVEIYHAYRSRLKPDAADSLRSKDFARVLRLNR